MIIFNANANQFDNVSVIKERDNHIEYLTKKKEYGICSKELVSVDGWLNRDNIHWSNAGWIKYVWCERTYEIGISKPHDTAWNNQTHTIEQKYIKEKVRVITHKTFGKSNSIHMILDIPNSPQFWWLSKDQKSIWAPYMFGKAVVTIS